MLESDGRISGMEGPYNELIVTTEELERTLIEYTDIVDNRYVEEIRETVNFLRDDGREKLNDGRLLRLGVVGQVKAGKSSLLNALLFDGAEVLPRAATPMTASLTHIQQSDRDEIEVKYYSRTDWNEIEERAGRYREAMEPPRTSTSVEGASIERASCATGGSQLRGPTESHRACHELVEMAKERGLRLERYLGNVDRQETDVGRLNDMLLDLVGAEGERTPLVKSVTIRCTGGIPDLDVVDTPGINDPISSRSHEAKKLLARCDAVLLVSYAGQFMDSEDAFFFQCRVPAEGIERSVLLGSKFDSAIVDVSKNQRGALDDALEDTRKKLLDHAKQALHGVNGTDGRDLREDDVFFVSSLCASISRRPLSTWSDPEREAFKSLQRAYPDWLDPAETELTDTTRDTLEEIGNMAAVKSCLETIRQDKERIKERGFHDFLREKRIKLSKELAELLEALVRRREELENADLLDINERIASLQEFLDDIRIDMQNAWDSLMEDQRKQIRRAANDVQSAHRDARKDIKDAVTTEKNLKSWFGRLFSDEVYNTKTSEDELAVREAVYHFAEDIENHLVNAVDKVFSVEFGENAASKLRNVIANCATNELGKTIEVKRMQSLIRLAILGIRRSAKERLDRDKVKHQKDLEDALERTQGKIKAEAGLQNTVALRKLAVQWADGIEETVRSAVERASEELLPDIEEIFKSEGEQLKRDLADREFSLQRYCLAIEALKTCSDRLA